MQSVANKSKIGLRPMRSSNFEECIVIGQVENSVFLLEEKQMPN